MPLYFGMSAGRNSTTQVAAGRLGATEGPGDRASGGVWRARAERLQELASQLVEGSGVASMLDAVVKPGPEPLGIDHVWLASFDRKRQELVDFRYAGPSSGREAPLEGIALASEHPLALATRDGETLFGRADPERPLPLCGGESASFAACPLVMRGEVLGAVLFAFDDARGVDESERGFDESERAFVGALARLCAAAIDREGASRTLQDSERAQRFLADAGVALAQTLDEIATLRSVTQLAIGSFADWCWVDLRETPSDTLVRVAVAGVDPSLPEVSLASDAGPSSFSPDPEYPALRALLEGEPVLVREFGDEAWRRVMPEWHASGVPAPRSLMAVPLRARGESFGALTLARSDASRPYDSRDLQFAMEVGRRASVAIENARLYATAQRDRAAAEEASRAKDQFLAVLGHELRNPLAPIVTALRLMAAREGSVCVSERATIERQVQHMTRLVDDLLDVSRITRGKVELRRRPVEIADVLAKAIEIASPALEGKQHRLAVDVPSIGLTVHGDAGRLAQVFANLLTNSAKYTPPSGEVRVVASWDDRFVRISVRDSGTGIAPELLPHVFEIFVQGARRDAVRAGLGLGLAIVRSLTELHGGRVEARSDGLNLGSEFVVELPLLVTTTRESARPPARDLPGPVAQPLRVLVVDDNVDAADMLAEWLIAIGHAVRVAPDGPTALELASTFHPDVALLDIGLPVMDGYEVARRLRQLSGCSETRLLALTGYGQESDHERSRKAGFENHLVKPVDLDAITHAISFAPQDGG